MFDQLLYGVGLIVGFLVVVRYFGHAVGLILFFVDLIFHALTRLLLSPFKRHKYVRGGRENHIVQLIKIES